MPNYWRVWLFAHLLFWVHTVVISQVLCLLFVVIVFKLHCLLLFRCHLSLAAKNLTLAMFLFLFLLFSLIYCRLTIRPGVKIGALICKIHGLIDFEKFTLATLMPFLFSWFSILPLIAEVFIASQDLRCFVFQKNSDGNF